MIFLVFFVYDYEKILFTSHMQNWFQISQELSNMYYFTSA